MQGPEHKSWKEDEDITRREVAEETRVAVPSSAEKVRKEMEKLAKKLKEMPWGHR
ncbi:MAG: hypothetical protein AAB345_00760 [Patescibacteria group bacterium]